MSVDRSVPSRALDAEVARALGVTDIFINDKMETVTGLLPDGRPTYVPRYTTAPAWDSSAWGEMLAWLNTAILRPSINIRTWPHHVTDTDSRGNVVEVQWDLIDSEGCVYDEVTVKSNEATLGHALAQVVLAVADWLRKEQGGEW